MQEPTPTPALPSSTAPRRCGPATAGCVLGLLALCTCFLGPLFGLPAVLCSHHGLACVRESKGALTGRRVAIAGLVMGYTALAIFATMMVLIQFGSWGHGQHPDIACTSNVKQMLLGLYMYAEDYGGFLPADLNAIRPYLGHDKILLCPGVKKHRGRHGCDYVYYGAGLKRPDLTTPAQTVLVADKPGNHPAVIVVGFADGHVVRNTVTPGASLEQVAGAKGWVLPNLERR
jgi:hypothetical protein